MRGRCSNMNISSSRGENGLRSLSGTSPTFFLSSCSLFSFDRFFAKGLLVFTSVGQSSLRSSYAMFQIELMVCNSRPTVDGDLGMSEPFSLIARRARNCFTSPLRMDAIERCNPAFGSPLPNTKARWPTIRSTLPDSSSLASGLLAFFAMN